MYLLLLCLSGLIIFSLHATAIPVVKPSQPLGTFPYLRTPQSLKYERLAKYGSVYDANRIISATISQVTSEQSWFHVPQTSITLKLVTFSDSPLDRRAVGRTILNGQVQVRRHLATHRDSYLWSTDERELMPVSLA